jgi:putative membrane protein
MYVAYHMTADSTKFGGDGVIKCVLFYITHIVLSIIIIPLVLITYVRLGKSLISIKIARIFLSGYMSPSLALLFI